jgi:hypothetical protein
MDFEACDGQKARGVVGKNLALRVSFSLSVAPGKWFFAGRRGFAQWLVILW